MSLILVALFYLGLFLVGVCVGGQLNRAIYRWTWVPRSISPWSKPPDGLATRHWFDCIPVFGWWTMQRESSIHGQLFWLRPMLIEIGCGVGLSVLYWWEVSHHHWPNAVFVSHATLFALMIVATFIDFDDRTIPDFLTVPGTILGLLFAAMAPTSLLPTKVTSLPPTTNSQLLLNTPFDWPTWLNGPFGLSIGLLCWLGWCFALLPRTLYLRRGWLRATQFLLASMSRGVISKVVRIIGVVGIVAIFTAWSAWSGLQNQSANMRWQALLSSLVGLACGGGLLWSIRIVARIALRIEAMGFGDVTLMAMIGSFLGWQATLMAFFIAPFTSVLVAVARYLVTGDRYGPFGPYLCAGTSVIIIGWITIWERWGPAFQLGWILPAIVVVAVITMGAVLAALEIFKKLIRLRRSA